MNNIDMATNYPFLAKRATLEYITKRNHENHMLYDEFRDDPDAQSKLRGHIDYLDDCYKDILLESIYTVWFCYVLGGWKALCSTTIEDGKYYEVTYDKDKNIVYVDEYAKKNQKKIDVDDLTSPLYCF